VAWAESVSADGDYPPRSQFRALAVLRVGQVPILAVKFSFYNRAIARRRVRLGDPAERALVLAINIERGVPKPPIVGRVAVPGEVALGPFNP
jgi:hypothetical protein